MADNSNKPDNWRGMDTNPRDGERFLGYHPAYEVEGVPEHVGPCVWCRTKDHYEYDFLFTEYALGAIGVYRPTKWMPLPPPPEGQ